MPHSSTRHLNIRLREVGTLFPPHLTNTWGEVANRDLKIIDEAIGAFCTPEQIESIKRALYQPRQGMFL